MIDLYMSTTPNGLKAALFLEEAGIAYRKIMVRLSKGEQFNPAFLEISPNGKIPAIIDHAPADGAGPLSVFESGAIMLYLAEKHGVLLPTSVRERAEVLQWLFWQVGGLGPFAGQAGYFRVYAAEPVPLAIERYTREVRRLFGVLDARLERRDYICGAFSIADIACYPWTVSHEGFGQDITAFGNLHLWFERMRARPATQRVYEGVEDVYSAKKGFSAEERAVLYGVAGSSGAASCAFICETCGTQFAPSDAPPALCPICEDERQYVGWNGQRWTTLEALAASHRVRIEAEEGLTAIGLEPAFAINQRAFLLETDAGNILWECLSIVADEGVAAMKARRGVDMIVISHPHFYAAMAAWSEAFGGAPIYLHAADRAWVQCPSPHIRFWSGDALQLSPDVTLIRAGGHFPGSTVLHWRRAPGGQALFPGDALQVVSDRRHVAFMYSYPNYIPMNPADVRAMRARLAPFAFDNVFGYTWGRNIIGGGRAAVDASFERYFAAIGVDA